MSYGDLTIVTCFYILGSISIARLTVKVQLRKNGCGDQAAGVVKLVCNLFLTEF